MPSACIAFANGCPRARVNAAFLFSYFEANGWSIRQSLREADLVLVFTCGVNQRSERKALKLLSVANRQRAATSRLVVLGCLPGINPAALGNGFNALLVPPLELDTLDDIIDAKIPISQIDDINTIKPRIDEAQSCFNMLDRFVSEFEASKVFLHRVRDKLRPKRSAFSEEDMFVIRIANGCLDECSYCAVRFAHGSLRSKDTQQVLREFQKGIGERREDFAVVAGDIGAYGQDISTNILELLRKMFACKAPFRLHMTEFNPRWFLRYQAGLIDLLAANRDRIAGLIFPVQSGSTRILELMRRGYSAAAASQCLRQLRRAIPELPVHTHVMVGFPGETDADFSDTLRFLHDARFDEIEVYKYEDRPGTKASQMANKIAGHRKSSRMLRIFKEFSGVARPAL